MVGPLLPHNSNLCVVLHDWYMLVHELCMLCCCRCCNADLLLQTLHQCCKLLVHAGYMCWQPWPTCQETCQHLSCIATSLWAGFSLRGAGDLLTAKLMSHDNSEWPAAQLRALSRQRTMQPAIDVLSAYLECSESPAWPAAQV